MFNFERLEKMPTLETTNSVDFYYPDQIKNKIFLFRDSYVCFNEKDYDTYPRNLLDRLIESSGLLNMSEKVEIEEEENNNNINTIVTELFDSELIKFKEEIDKYIENKIDGLILKNTNDNIDIESILLKVDNHIEKVISNINIPTEFDLDPVLLKIDEYIENNLSNLDTPTETITESVLLKIDERIESKLNIKSNIDIDYILSKVDDRLENKGISSSDIDINNILNKVDEYIKIKLTSIPPLLPMTTNDMNLNIDKKDVIQSVKNGATLSDAIILQLISR